MISPNRVTNVIAPLDLEIRSNEAICYDQEIVACDLYLFSDRQINFPKTLLGL